MELRELGFDAHFARSLDEACARFALPLQAARVATSTRGYLLLLTGTGAVDATLAGAFHELDAEAQPVTGDWVAYEPDTLRVRSVLDRRGLLARKRAGRAHYAQPLAANVDVLLIVMGLDGDFNPRRLERYLLLAAESNVTPVVVLNKSDLCDDVVARVRVVEPLTRGEVVVLSALDHASVMQLHRFVESAQTAALVGSSGAGKSTLTNALLGSARQLTGAVRGGDQRGRHTTTTRELVVVPQGWMLIDTPGLRELEVWAGAGAATPVFAEIATLAMQCRFRDCTHRDEPGCAVRAALESGAVDEERLASFHKLSGELDAQERKRRERMLSRTVNQLFRSGPWLKRDR